jgi:hypothetical protein
MPRENTLLVTLMMEAICSSKASDRTRVTLRYAHEDSILHGHSHKNLDLNIFYVNLYLWGYIEKVTFL